MKKKMVVKKNKIQVIATFAVMFGLFLFHHLLYERYGYEVLNAFFPTGNGFALGDFFLKLHVCAPIITLLLGLEELEKEWYKA